MYTNRNKKHQQKQYMQTGFVKTQDSQTHMYTKQYKHTSTKDTNKVKSQYIISKAMLKQIWKKIFLTESCIIISQARCSQNTL